MAVRLLCGEHGRPVDELLHAAQIDPARLAEAGVALRTLGATPYRLILASYAALTAPTYRPPASRPC